MNPSAKLGICSPLEGEQNTFAVPMRCSEMPNPKILIIRPSALGDVCRSVPVLVSLRKRFPASCIDWLVQDSFAPAIADHPDLTGVIQFPRRDFSDWWRNTRTSASMVAWMRSLRKKRYDVVFDCQGLFRSAFFTWQTGAQLRVGFADAREFGWIGYNRRHRIDSALHTVDRMLALVEAEGVPAVRAMELYVPPADLEWWVRQRSAQGHEVINTVLAPTSRWPSKRWPQDSFLRLVDEILARKNQRVYIVGATGEEYQCDRLIARCNGSDVVNLVGRTSVGQLMAVIASADLVIANDSAVLHMAVGFNRPYVGLFGPTETARVGPYTRNGAHETTKGIVLQHVGKDERLHHKDPQLADGRIMARISVPEVIGAMQSLVS